MVTDDFFNGRLILSERHFRSKETRSSNAAAELYLDQKKISNSVDVSIPKLFKKPNQTTSENAS